MNLSGKKILMIVAPENFRDEECFVPKEYFEKAGAEVTVASKKTGILRGMLGGTIEVNTNYTEVDPLNYDAIIFVGGTGASVYFEDERAHEIARKAYDNGKIVAAICIAPSTLANAGLLVGKRATSWPSQEEHLKEKGANYTGEDVEVDGRIVTAKGPHAAKEFAEEIAKLI